MSSADPLMLIPCCLWAPWPPRVKSPKWAQAVAPQRTSGPAAHQFWEPEHRQKVEAATPKRGCQEGPAGWLGSCGSRRKPFPWLTGHRCPARQDSSPRAPPLWGDVRGQVTSPLPSVSEVSRLHTLHKINICSNSDLKGVNG